MTLAAVSQRVDTIAGRQETRDAVDQALTRYLNEVGCLVVLIPNSPDNAASVLERIAPEAIVLSGGNDIGEVPSRDATERAMMAYARLHCLPLLAICRGLQFLITESGGTLQPVADHVGSRHGIHGAINAGVNSFHCWGIETVPPEYETLAWADDGSIEAIRHRHLPWEGWMWHPERDTPFAPEALARGRSLLLTQAMKGKQ
jgi:gamma-glutamyl-gamma-aminobutyrate hydrolase PuuD